MTMAWTVEEHYRGLGVPGPVPSARHEPRLFPGQRWLNIVLRGLHLTGIAGMAGGFLFDLPETQWAIYGLLAIATGAALTALYIRTDAGWLLKLKGQAILAKLALLALAHFLPAVRAEVFVLVVLLSAFFAHAPDRVRSYAWGRPMRRPATPLPLRVPPR
jgi:uncharacterized membrane protein